MDAFSALRERGFVQQSTDEAALAGHLSSRDVTYYIGFDPTADSLHVGSLVPIMAMANLQRAGHRPIAVIGGGTAMIGDPSGKTETRRIMTKREIETNGKGILAQLQRYLTLDGERGLFLNNADWILPLNYIDFLRDIGCHFRVNEMIKAEGYKQRLEREDGLSFIEFNYQLLQAYDYLHLFDDFGCTLQMGGNDQWGNILAGTGLIRRMKGRIAHALTFPLITTAKGHKMGKTEKGTVWLDSTRTTPYEFYQYWINTDDRDVRRFLALFTFLSMEEVDELARLADSDIREAKEVLAFEVTKLAHGEDEAKAAQDSSRAVFSGDTTDSAVSMPIKTIPRERIKGGLTIVDLLTSTGITKTRSEARRLIQGGGVYLNEERVASDQLQVTEQCLVEASPLIVRIGKKNHYKILRENV